MFAFVGCHTVQPYTNGNVCHMNSRLPPLLCKWNIGLKPFQLVQWRSPDNFFIWIGLPRTAVSWHRNLNILAQGGPYLQEHELIFRVLQGTCQHIKFAHLCFLALTFSSSFFMRIRVLL